MTPNNMTVDLAFLERVVGRMTNRQKSNAQSVIVALGAYGAKMGLNQPHRVAQYVAQILEESGAFNYDREIWGPTAAQKRYEGRKDLGNTQPGDGKKFAGHGPLQITGRANTRSFRDWCRKFMAGTGISVPNFENNPGLINTDPWEGLGPLWYWDTHGLNRYADQGDIEMITKRINGGLNGYARRIDWYVKVALVMLGYDRSDVAGFQKAVGLTVDGVPGPRTRAALHKALVAKTPVVFQDKEVATAPVVEKKTVEKPVVPDAVEKEVKKKRDTFGWLGGLFGSVGTGIAGLMGADWKTVAAIGGTVLTFGVLLVLMNSQIVGAIKNIKKGIEGEEDVS